MFGSCFEWIASPCALPQTRDNRRSARTGDTAGKVAECVSVSDAFVVVFPPSLFGCRVSGSFPAAPLKTAGSLLEVRVVLRVVFYPTFSGVNPE